VIYKLKELEVISAGADTSIAELQPIMVNDNINAKKSYRNIFINPEGNIRRQMRAQILDLFAPPAPDISPYFPTKIGNSRN